MTYAGARGQTAEQMAAVLDLPNNATDALHQARAEMDALTADAERDSVEILVSNALWGESSLHFEAPFVSALSSEMRAPLEEVSFKTDPETARLSINAWVARNTKDHIRDLFAPGTLTKDARLVLANAIYFHGTWATSFEKDATADAPFHLASANDVSAPTMHRTGPIAYAEDEAVQVIELPYTQGEFAMMIVLPRDADDLPKIEASLSATRIAGWAKSASRQAVSVSLPRFEARQKVDLVPQLAALGMRDAFDPGRADFSGVTKDEPLSISAVVHEAWLRADETGTEAAAATGVAMRVTSVAPVPKEFRADHPFVYLVRHVPSGRVLFMGRVSNPTQTSE